MSTLMSTDMNITRSSTRRHAPPGGQTTISLGSDEPKAASQAGPGPAAVAGVAAAANGACAPRPAFGGAIGIAHVVGSTITAPLLEKLSESNAAVTTLEVADPLSLPFATQRLLAQGAAAVVAVGNLKGSLMWRASAPALASALIGLGLEAARPVIVAVVDGDEEEGAGAAYAAEALRLARMVRGSAGKAEPAASEPGGIFAPPKALSPDVNTLLAQLRAAFAQQGAKGIFGLGRKFRIADDDNSGSLSAAEFSKCLKECKLVWSDDQVNKVFAAFDTDGSGSIIYDEFLLAARGVPNARRSQLILAAFALMDSDKNGVVNLDDIRRSYDASQHPDVKAGRKKADEVLREFLDTFDGGEKDGKVTPEEWCRYYAGVSASVDNDDYFELMMRNAWHMSGGEGWAANTTCRRVLATHLDGRQTVEEIKNDLGIAGDDKAAMLAKLKEQGVDVTSIELFGGADNTTPPAAENGNGKASPTRPSSSASAAATSPYAQRVRQVPGGNSTIRLG